MRNIYSFHVAHRGPTLSIVHCLFGQTIYTRTKGHRDFKDLNFLCIGRDTLVIMFSLQNMLVTKYVVTLMLTRIQGWHPLWCNALRRGSNSCSSLLIRLITSLSGIIYRVQ
jgi:hypothetical protein